MPRALHLHGEIPAPASRPAVALFAKGFRPFFLLASAFATLIVPLWLLIVRGHVTPRPYLDPMSWHAHEMVFGYVTAVIAGFLLTAVGNWTQRDTAVGAPLGALAGLWVAGRVAMLLAGSLPRSLSAIVDLLFLPALLIALGHPLLATRSRRNYGLLALVAALFAANLVMHLEALGVLAYGAARRASLAAVDLVLVVISVIAGRVFPMFTRNATQVASIRSIRALDLLAVGGMVLLTLMDALAFGSQPAAVLSGVVAVLAAARAVHWGARHSLRQPLLWILHAGYAWMIVGLVLRAVAGFEPSLFASLATHALTVGVIGSLTLGMMARVSLGHTGRVLAVARPIAWAFAAINLAAVLRALVPIVAPASYLAALIASGTLWTLGFLAFLIVYAPILTKPRVDGKPG